MILRAFLRGSFRPASLMGRAFLTLLVGSCLASADTMVAPGNMATSDATLGSGVLRASSYRSQSVYGASHFPPGIALIITELRYRPDRFYGAAFSTTIANLQVNLSTTARDPDGLSPTFANNPGFDDTVVFSGALACSSAFTGPANGPKDFDIVIPLATPFLYNPAAGNLLVEIRNFSGSTAASHLSGQFVPNDAGSRLGGSLTSANGSADSAVEAIFIGYTPTNQPPVPPQPTRLVRGPYLQNGTTSNLLVRWRTSRFTNSVVQFGLDHLSLNWAVTNSVLTNEHFVTLTNLAPDTKYFYAFGTADTNFAGGTDYHFITAPIGPKPTRIWVIGDAGSASIGDSAGVIRDPVGMRDAYYAHATNRYTDIWLMLGDNAYGSGTDEEYQTNVFGLFPDLLRRSVVWSAIGNHDAASADVYQDTFTLPAQGEAGGVPSGSELYYSFNYGNIHFVCLDSEISPNSPGSPMLTWLEQDLQNNTNDWLIAFWHSPPYTYGSHNSDDVFDSGGHLVQMRQNVVPILEGHGVDLVLCGHSHVYERTYLLDGHYGFASSFTPLMMKDSGSGREDDTGSYRKGSAGPAENEGAVYAVVGSSGWAWPGYGTIPAGKYLKHPATYIGLKQVGSLVLDVNTNRLDAKFLRNDGVIDDYFTLLKGAAPEPLGIKTMRLAGGSLTIQFKTLSGQRYQVQRTASLHPKDWQPVGGEILATGATTRWTGVASSTDAFYRIVHMTD